MMDFSIDKLKKNFYLADENERIETSKKDFLYSLDNSESDYGLEHEETGKQKKS